MDFLIFYEFLFLEILLFIGLGGYLVYHTGSHVFYNYRSTKQKITSKKATKSKRSLATQEPIKKESKKTKKKKVPIQQQKQIKVQKLTVAEIQEIEEIVKKIQAKNSIGEYEESYNLIVQGLIIDKKNIELNKLLAINYESQGHYQKAELIYKDLIIENEPQDAELYIQLGNILLLQGKDALAHEIFKKGLLKEPTNTGLLKIASEIAFKIRNFESAIDHSTAYLKHGSKNTEILEIQSQSYLQLGQDEEAYNSLLVLRQIDPYNNTVQKGVQTLEKRLSESN